MRVRKLLAVAAMVGGLSAVTQAVAVGQESYVYTDRLGYGGEAGSTVTRYTTLADALNGVNGVYTNTFPQRDLMLNTQVGGGVPFYSYFQTAILYGEPSPSISPHGFIQMADFDGTAVTSQSSYWLTDDRTSIQHNVHGENTLPTCGFLGDSGDCGWVWSEGDVFGGPFTPADGTTYLGSFLFYDVALTAFGLDPAVWNPTWGWYESISHPTSVIGSISGLFHFDTPDPLYDAANGYYVFNINMNMESWGFDTYGGIWDPDNGLFGADSYFASSETVVPEPATMTLMATGLAGLMASRRRKKA
jgi:hypothetical protein